MITTRQEPGKTRNNRIAPGPLLERSNLGCFPNPIDIHPNLSQEKQTIKSPQTMLVSMNGPRTANLLSTGEMRCGA